MHKNIELTQAMSAKLCHDLANSIGAIDNCLGLIDHENKTISSKAKDLAVEESNNLVTKIKFFRGAYGLSDGEANMSLVNIAKLLTDFLKSTKVKLNFHFEKGIIYVEAPVAKAALGLAILVCENISNSGTIDLYINKDEANPIKLLGKGKSLLLNNDDLEILQNTKKHLINVKTCRQHYINAVIAKTSYKISACNTSNSIEYNLIKK